MSLFKLKMLYSFKTFVSLLSGHASYWSDKSYWYPLDLQLSAPYTGFVCVYIYIYGRKSNLYRESKPILQSGRRSLYPGITLVHTKFMNFKIIYGGKVRLCARRQVHTGEWKYISPHS